MSTQVETATGVPVRRQTKYASGAVRDTRRGKGRFDLIAPEMMERLSHVLEYGAEHYGPDNWRKGFPFRSCLDSALRHINRWQRGLTDSDHGDHLAAAVFNLMCLTAYEDMVAKGELPADLDDVHRHPASSADAKVERVYVSGPFSSPDPSHRLANMLAAVLAGKIIAARGHDVHVPHSATYLFHGTLDYERFMRLDLGLLNHWATALYCCGPSPGANRELQRAHDKNLTVYRSHSDVPVLSGAMRWFPETTDIQQVVRDHLAAGGLISEADIPNYNLLCRLVSRRVCRWLSGPADQPLPSQDDCTC